MDSHFLGIDIGSSFTKFIVIDNTGEIIFEEIIQTLSRNRQAFEDIKNEIDQRFHVIKTCTTGYGRNSFKGDIQKTELICAAKGVTFYSSTHKCIIDIGGEDIKIIECGPAGEVINFSMNDKCSAGTGTFITEIADKAEIEIHEMNDLARNSTSDRVINSFCTVFAKTEILGWKFNGVSEEDIAKGIYLSIVNRIGKLPVQTEIPNYLCGGVIAYHPYLKDLLEKDFNREVEIIPNPQMVIALGAALFALEEN
jgi:predicted CoA-substrate-specific enzyme activase